MVPAEALFEVGVPLQVNFLVARVGDRVYDGSIRTQLERMRERIL